MNEIEVFLSNNIDIIKLLFNEYYNTFEKKTKIIELLFIDEYILTVQNILLSTRYLNIFLVFNLARTKSMVAEIVRNSQGEIRSSKYANEIEIQAWILHFIA